MIDIKWIKITTDMFNDEKIRLIESMPDADSVLVIWIKLLVQAGRTNANGYIFLNENIPYTDEMLATVFNRPLNTVRLALDTFKKFGMIEMDGNGVYIKNWEKHQNVEGMERIREQNRLRVQKHRQKKKIEPPKEDVTLHETLRNAPEREEELELDIDKEKSTDSKTSRTPHNEIIELYNSICTSLPKVRDITNNRKQAMRLRWKKYSDLTTFQELFEKAEASEFLTGRNGKWSGCNFDWLMKEANMVKVLEGNYDDREAQNGKDKQHTEKPKDMAGKYRKFVKQ